MAAAAGTQDPAVAEVLGDPDVEGPVEADV